jgi:hypothetical protein
MIRCIYRHKKQVRHCEERNNPVCYILDCFVPRNDVHYKLHKIRQYLGTIDYVDYLHKNKKYAQ